jgi:hypothetical protein
VWLRNWSLIPGRANGFVASPECPDWLRFNPALCRILLPGLYPGVRRSGRGYAPAFPHMPYWLRYLLSGGPNFIFTFPLLHFMKNEGTMQDLRRSVAGLSTRRLKINPRPVHVPFMVGKVALRQVFLYVLWLWPVRIISVLFHTHSLIHHRRCTILTNDSIVTEHTSKQRVAGYRRCLITDLFRCDPSL